MLLNHTNLDFLRSRIAEIRSAIFNDMSEDPSKFSTCIISSLEADELGNIWFLMARNGRQLQQGDLFFPARLSFYRKGHNFSLNVNGRGLIVANSEAIARVVGLNAEEQKKGMAQTVLVKVEMESAEYFEWSTHSHESKIQKTWQQILTWFHHRHEPATQLAVYSVRQV